MQTLENRETVAEEGTTAAVTLITDILTVINRVGFSK